MNRRVPPATLAFMDSPPEQLDVEPIAQVEGVLERIVYENPENGFFVGRMKVEGSIDLVTVVGNLMAISTGETIRVRGRWIDDKKFGRQLRVESYETVLPNSIEGIEKYLGSGLVKGIGPAYAKRLVAAFGAETLRVIDQQPQRLRAVDGREDHQVHRLLSAHRVGRRCARQQHEREDHETDHFARKDHDAPVQQRVGQEQHLVGHRHGRPSRGHIRYFYGEKRCVIHR